MFYLDELLAKNVDTLKSKKKSERLNYLIENYEKDYKFFHRVFLHSGIAFGLNQNTFDTLIDLFKSMNLPQIYLNDMLFFKHKVQAYNNLDQEIRNNLKNVSLEQIISFIEYAIANMDMYQTSFDFQQYHEKILDSQKDFVLSHYYDILLELFNHAHTHSSCKYSFKKNKLNIYPILKKISNKYSLSSQILSVCVEMNKPTPAQIIEHEGRSLIAYTYLGQPMFFPFSKSLSNEKKDLIDTLNLNELYLMIYSQWFYKPNEINRDLNDDYFYQTRFDHDETLAMMEASNFLSYDRVKDIMHFKGQHGEDFTNLKKDHTPQKVLTQIYSLKDTEFEYKNEKFHIKELVCIFNKILNIANKKLRENLSNIDKKNYSYFEIEGEKSLYRKLQLTETQKKLFELFVWNIKETKNKKENQCKPIVHIKNLYYLIPSRIAYIALENIIDSILSKKEIEKTLSRAKGFQFEQALESFFTSKNIPFYRLNKDELLDSPEIDGMFIYDNFLFIYEAKASVIPQNIVETYNYLNSVIYEKAYCQLEKRIEWILENQAEFEKKFDFKINPKKILPMIIVNHATSTGYQGFYIDSIKKEVAVVDYFLLKYTLEKRTAIHWYFDDSIKQYRKIDRKLSNALKIYLYLLRPYRYLKDIDTPTLQINEDVIAFFIVQRGNISPYSLIF